MKYDLFISYSTDPDYKLSKKLENFLESFSSVVSEYGVELKELEVCRDGSDFKLKKIDLKEGHHINQMLEDHLAESKMLIVLCSKNAATSPYVAHEIEWFLENKGSSQILAAFTEGEEPGAHPEEFFPKPLLDHGIHQTVCYDFRELKRGSADWKKVRDEGEEMTKLAAHLYGTSTGELLPLWKREEKKRKMQKKMNRIMSGGIITLLLMLSAVTFLSYKVSQAKQVSDQKSEVTNLANIAFNIRDTDRKQSYGKLREAKNKTLSEQSRPISSLNKERAIIESLISDLQINLATLPFYTQTLIDGEHKDVLKIKTRKVGDEKMSEKFNLYILSKNDHQIKVLTFENTGKKYKKIKEDSLVNMPFEAKILRFEPAASRMFTFDTQNHLKLIVGGKMTECVNIPGLVDFDFDKNKEVLYVATKTKWMVFKSPEHSGELKLLYERNKKVGKIPFDQTTRLKNYDDDVITFLYKNEIYTIDKSFLKIPKKIQFVNEIAKGITHYKFDDDKNINDPERGTLAISRGRRVEVYKKISGFQYYKTHTIDDHASFINSFDFNDAHEILIGSSDKTATVWSKNILKKKLLGHDAGITDVTFVDNNLVITCDERNIIRLWNLKEIALDVLELGFTQPIVKLKNIGYNRVGLATIDTLLILSYENGALRTTPLYTDQDTLDFFRVFKYDQIYQIKDSSYVDEVTFVERGDTICLGDKNGHIFVYTGRDNQEIFNSEGELLRKGLSRKAINDVDFLCNTQYILAGGRDNLIDVWMWDGKHYKFKESIKDHNDDIIDIDSYGNLFLTVSHDQSVLLYEMVDGKINKLTSMIKHNTFINEAAFLNDSLIISGDDEGTIKIWNRNNFDAILNEITTNNLREL